MKLNFSGLIPGMVAVMLCFGWTSGVFSQSIQSCQVGVAYEPRPQKISIRPAKITQSNASYVKKWTQKDEATFANDSKASVLLSSFDHSAKLFMTEWGASIPAGATIHGIEVWMEGQSTEYKSLGELTIALFANNLQIVSQNKANSSYLQKPWSALPDNSDKKWCYGSKNDTWGVTWSSDLLNGKDFGLEIQLRNATNQSLTAFLDDVEIIIHYTPLYAFCKDSCVVFYVDPYKYGKGYNWIIPANFMAKSRETENTINLMAGNGVTEGTYEICAEILNGAGQVTDTCCRKFNYTDCAIGSISGTVWADANYNKQRDVSEPGIGNVTLQLKTLSGQTVREVNSESNGQYVFNDIPSGQYYIFVQRPDGKLIVLKDAAIPVDRNSDFTNQNGPSTTDVLTVATADIQNIDFGLINASSIGNFVWHDLNQNGIQDQNEPGLANQKVILLDGNQNQLGMTQTNGSGMYGFVDLYPGTYTLKFEPLTDFIPTCRALSPQNNSDINDLGLTGNITLTQGTLIDTTDAGFFKYASFTGIAFEDKKADGIRHSDDPGIGQVVCVLSGLSGCGAAISDTVLTDAEGRYQFTNVNPGTYDIAFHFPSQFLPTQIGSGPEANLMNPFNKIAFIIVKSGDNIQRLNAGVYTPGAVSGKVWLDENTNSFREDEEEGVENITVSLSGVDALGNIVNTQTVTDTIGNYRFDDLHPGLYTISISPDTKYRISPKMILSDTTRDHDSEAGWIFDVQTCSNTENKHLDFALFLLSEIGDFVWEDLNGNGIQDPNEGGIASVLVTLVGEDIFGQPVSVSQTSDFSGAYNFTDVVPGYYVLSFLSNGDFVPTSANAGSDDETDSDINGSGQTDTIWIGSGQVQDNHDAGYFIPGTISGMVWEDLACDGNLDIQDIRLEGIQIHLNGFDGAGNVIALSTLTIQSGQYLFQDLPPGEYSVSVDLINGYLTPVPVFQNVLIQSGDNLQDYNFPLYQSGSLGDFVWFDLNENGVQDIDEPGIDGVEVSLSGNAGGQTVTLTTITENGFYFFPDLKPGTYTLKFTTTSDFESTIKNVGSDQNIDSNIDENGETDEIIIWSGQHFTDIDAGFIESAKGEIGDFVWHDLNGNGIQDFGEPGLEGIVIQLDGVENSGNIVSEITTSDALGSYRFFNIKNGEYTLTFEGGTEFLISPALQGNGSNDSKPNVSTGQTASFTVSNGAILNDYDAGLYKLASVGDFVWFDSDENGIQDIGESGFEGVELSVYQSNTNLLVGSMNSDVAGNYMINGLFPGNYFVVARVPVELTETIYQAGQEDVDSDFYRQNDTLRTNVFTLSSGEIQTGIDLGLQNKRTEISGLVWRDLNADGIYDGIENVYDSLLVVLKNEAGDTLEITYTDSTGRYKFENLTTALYRVQFPVFDSLTFTQYQQGNDTETDNDVLDFITGTITININLGERKTGVNAGYVTKSGLGDFVWLDLDEDGLQDSEETGVNGIAVYLYNLSGELLDSTVTGLHETSGNSGYYQFKSLFPGDYYVRFTLPNNLLFTINDVNFPNSNSDVTGQFGIGTTGSIVVGYQQVRNDIDAGFIIDENAQGQMSGLVWQDVNANGTRESSDLLLEGVEVKLFDLSGMEIAITFTDTAGQYKFDNLFFGSYYLMIPDVENRVFVLYNGMNLTVDSEITNEFGLGSSRIISLFPGDSLTNLDLGYAPKISLGDFVWDDLNNNGVQDDGEPGVPGILIQLLNQAGIVMDSRTTDADGYYIFDNLPAGNYGLRAVVNGGYLLATPNVGPFDKDSKADLSGYIANRDFLNADDYDNLDIGLIKAATIGNRLWLDLNGNGIFSINEPGIQDVMVELYDESGVFVKMTKTGAVQGQDFVGFYSFKGIRPGNYYVKFLVPDQYLLSPANVGAPETDSDLTNEFGRGTTSIFTVNVGEMKMNIDGAAYLPACIGDRVWNDMNNNGNQDMDEPGIEDVLVSLFTSAGQLIDTVRTDANGEYKFFNLRSRLYYLRFQLLESFEFTLPFNGSSPATDSDVDETGTTPLISLAHGSVFLDVDAGMTASQNRIILGEVWEDPDKNGLKNENEGILSDIIVNLLDTQGNILSQSKTNHAGLYAHSISNNGKYYIQVIEKEHFRITQRAVHVDLVCNDINADGMSDPIHYQSSPNIQHKNGGMYFVPSTKVSGTVWLDVDDNLLWDSDIDSTIKDVVVLLFTPQNVFIKSTKTDENGFYEISGIDPGSYYIKIPVLDQRTFIMRSESSDSYITNEKGLGTSSVIMVDVQNPGIHFNVGYRRLPALQEQPEAENGRNISVYPNPTIYNIFVEMDFDDNAPYRIVNSSGKTIKQGQTLTRKNEIDLTDVPLGVYIIEIYTKEGVIRKKFFRAENY